MSYALEIKHLCKSYKDGTEALQHIDLKVKKGDFFALLGPNGAGKSTIIGIITSLINKTSGQVLIHGIDMEKKPSNAKSLIGLVPQEFNFSQFEPLLEVIYNQAGYYGIEHNIAKERAEEYLSYLGLWKKRNTEMQFLSGGMKRRVMIARALIHHPKLLILDEPTAGVDIEVRRTIWDFISSINQQGTTVILTTHYLEEAENLCRSIAIIDQGKIIEDTTMRALLEKLDSESFLLYLSQPLTVVPELTGTKVQLIDKQTLEIKVDTGNELGEIFIQLKSQGIHINRMKNKVNRLEELFINLISNKIK